MTRRFSTEPHPAGITILEVLIAMGILAIGLTSVLSLIPLGRSLLTKAIVADQSGSVLDNARAAFMTAGLANVEALTGTDGGPCPNPPLVIDPLGLASGIWPAEYGLNPAVLRAGGTLADGSPESAQPRAWPVSALVFSSGDDVLMTVPDNLDLPAENRFENGVRSTAGRTTWFAILSKSTATPFTAGELATLSIVVCRNRVPGLMPPATGAAMPLKLLLTPRGPEGHRSYGPPYRISWPAATELFPDRRNHEVIRKGAVVLVPPSAPSAEDPADTYRPPRFLTLSAVTFLRPGAGGESGAEITFDGDPSLVPGPSADGVGTELPPLTLPVAILPDATAVRDFTTTIEGLNEFTR